VDLGTGNGLLNSLTESMGKDDFGAVKIYVASAFYLVLIIALCFGLVWLLVAPRISWAWLFNTITPQTSAEVAPALSVFVLCVLIGLPFGLVFKIYESYQEGYINGGLRIIGSILGLVGILVAMRYQAGLPWLVLSMAGSPVLASFFGFMWLILERRPFLLPRIKNFRKTAFIDIFRSGVLFFILQFTAAIGFQADSLVVSHFLGADQVPQYAIPMKLFMYVPALLNFFLVPLWPAYGDAIARGDTSWVVKTFKRSLYLSFGISSVMSLILVFFGKMIIGFWVPEIQLEWSFLFGLGLWVILLGIAGPLSAFLNGANVIGFQTVIAVFAVIINIALSIFLVQKIGVSGPIYGSVISWFLFVFLPMTFFIPRLISSWKSKKILI
ncbi:MAG: hypothetical protein OEY59_13815, partial [Deltaproteobacteria bacterium]|nr:hypothetical protein [Deltaproteobacteria bacterium]